MLTPPPLPIPPIADAPLERALLHRLGQVGTPEPALGPHLQLALRLGLIQKTVAPRFSSPRVVVFAADHGLALDEIEGHERRSTAVTVQRLLGDELPVTSYARLNGLELMVVDAGISEQVPAHAHLHPRKIAHGTRHARVGNAMSMEQAQAAIRAGLEIGESLGGNAVACAGIGVGSTQSAALLLSCLAQVPLREIVDTGPAMEPGLLDHTVAVLERIRQRHAGVADPLELLAAMGGFEVAMMVGLLLAAAARRFVLIPDGVPACAAVMVASKIAPAAVDYCVHARSNRSPGLERALGLFGARSLYEVSMDAIDGTGAALTWPLIVSATRLLAEGSD